MAKVVAELQAKLSLDTSNFKNGLRVAQNTMSDFTKSVTNQNTQIRKSFESMYRSITQTNKNIAGSLRSMGSAFKETSVGIKALSTESKNSLSQYRKDLTQVNTDMKLLNQSTEKTFKSMTSSMLGMTRANKSMTKSTTDGLNTLMKANNSAMSSLDRLKSSGQNSLKALNKDLQQTQRGLDKSFSSMGKANATDTSRSTSKAQASPKISAVNPVDTSLSVKEILKLGLQSDRTTQKMINNNKKVSKSFGDVGNMVKGILFAQTFYGALGAVQSMIGGMFQMSNAVETTEMAFNSMLKDAQLAKEVTDYVIDYANESAFSFESATNAAKQLLAYGFDVQQLSTLIETIGDAAAAMGDQGAFERIARALGQIQTRGKVATGEMLQLTEAGIPAFEILEEKLGLTKEALGELGNQGISSGVAIQALIEGIQERYGGAMAMMSQTTEGLINNIRDSFSYLGSQALQPLLSSFKNVLKGMASSLNEWIAIVRDSGIGGLFEALIPKDIQEPIRQLIANLDGVRIAFMNVITSLGPLVSEFLNLGIAIANVVLPVIQTFLQFINGLLWALNETGNGIKLFVGAAVGFFIFFTINNLIRTFLDTTSQLNSTVMGLINYFKGLGTIFMQVAQQGGIFAGVMAVVKSILTGGLGAASAISALAALGGTVATVIALFNQLNASMGAAMGNKSYKYLQPQIKSATSSNTKFNKTLSETNSGMEDLADNTDKAGKAAKKAGKEATDAILAFDEVFNIKPPDETTDTGSGGIGGGVGMPDIGAPDIGMPEIPNMSDYANQFKDEFDKAFSGLVLDPWSDWQIFSDQFVSGVKYGWTTVVDVFKEGFGLIGALFSGNWGTLQAQWAQLSSAWAQEPAKAMNLIKTSSHNAMQEVTQTYQTAMEKLPGLTKDGIGEAAALFTAHLKSLDDDALTILRGTSDSMAMLFYNISEDMSDDEAMKQFVTNLSNMVQSGKTLSGEMSEDLVDGLKKINENLKTYGQMMETETNKVFGAVKKNAHQNSMEMANDVVTIMGDMSDESVNALINMPGDFGAIFEGIKTDNTQTMDDWNNIIQGNIEELRKNGPLNIEKMSKEIQEYFNQFTENSKEMVWALASQTDLATADMSAFANKNTEEMANAINSWIASIPPEANKNLTELKQKTLDRLVETGVIGKEQAEKLAKAIGIGSSTAKSEVEANMNKIKEYMESPTTKAIFETAASSIGKAMVEAIGTAWSKAWRGTANTMIDGVNGLIGKVNEFIGATNELPLLNIPKIPTIPRLAKGGIVTSQTLAMIGEGGRREAVLPLQDASTMETLGQAIGGYVSQAMADGLAMQSSMLHGIPINYNAPDNGPMGNSAMPNNGNQVIINAYAMDDANLRALLRRLRVIAERENRRTFGTQPLVF